MPPNGIVSYGLLNRKTAMIGRECYLSAEMIKAKGERVIKRFSLDKYRIGGMGCNREVNAIDIRG